MNDFDDQQPYDGRSRPDRARASQPGRSRSSQPERPRTASGWSRSDVNQGRGGSNRPRFADPAEEGTPAHLNPHARLRWPGDRWNTPEPSDSGRMRTQREPEHADTSVPERSKLPIVAAIVVAVLLVFVAVAIACCTTVSDGGELIDLDDTGYQSPYDWDGMVIDTGRFTYRENGVVKSQVGVDVSSLQGTIDWEAVASDGISFAMVRVGNRGLTEGGLFTDEAAATNIEGAQAAGLDVGVYFFSQAITEHEAREEADLVLKQLNGRKLELPVAFDHESVTDSSARANGLDRETMTAVTLAFCERIEEGGYKTMIYGNRGDLMRLNLKELNDRPLWLAEYDVLHPTVPLELAMWQFTNSGSVLGIDTSVDLNLRFTDSV